MMDVSVWLKLRQNGVVSDSMTKAGVKYELNYGVSLLEIKRYSLESNFSDEDLANFWKSGVREKMIICTYSFPLKDIDINFAHELAKGFRNFEIVDLTAVNLLCKCDNAFNIALDYIKSNSEMTKRCGFVILSRLFNSDNERILLNIESVLSVIQDCVNIKSKAVVSGICRFFTSFFMVNNSGNKVVDCWIEANSQNDFFKQNIWTEVSYYYE